MDFELSIVDLNVKSDGKFNPLDTDCLAKQSELYQEIMDDYFIHSKVREINESSYILQEHFDSMVNWYRLNDLNKKKQEIKQFNKSLFSFLGTISHFLESLKSFCTTEDFKLTTSHFYDKSISYRLLYEMRNISQHKPKNILVTIDENSEVVVNKTLLFKDNHLSVVKEEVITGKLPEKILLLFHINTFYMNLLEMKEWIFVKNFDITNQLRFLATISKYNLNAHTYICKKYKSGNFDYYVLTSHFMDLIKDSIDFYYNKCSVHGKELGYNFEYTDYFKRK